MLRTNLCLVAAACVLPMTVHASPVRWEVAAGGNGHSYEAVHVGPFTTWADADRMATASGGYLATVTSAAENAFVFSLVWDRQELWSTVPSTNARLGPWLGATRPHLIGALGDGWQWVSGEPFDYSNWVTLDGIAEPSYLQYWGTEGGWNDAEDGLWDVRGYVVESVPCPPDFNGNLVLSVQDIFDFLAAYFNGEFRADFNGSGNISVQDIFDFLAAYFAGC